MASHLVFLFPLIGRGKQSGSVLALQVPKREFPFQKENHNAGAWLNFGVVARGVEQAPAVAPLPATCPI
jgi:hypothetical protein